jgi:hypothetical protein
VIHARVFYFVIKFGMESKSPKGQLRAFCGKLRRHPEERRVPHFFFTMSSGYLQGGRHIGVINPS